MKILREDYISETDLVYLDSIESDFAWITVLNNNAEKTMKIPFSELSRLLQLASFKMITNKGVKQNENI